MACYLLASPALITVTGPDAAAFLQGQITQDIYAASASQPVYTAFCAANGRVLFLGHIAERAGVFYLYHPHAAIGPQWLRHLQLYSRFSKVKIQSVADTHSVYWQPRWGTDGQETPVYSDHLWVWQSPLHREYLFAPEHASPADLQAEASGSHTWHLNRIRTLYPVWTPSVSGVVFPHSLNLHRMRGIHFQKGCYLGQEIVARMQFKGRPKREMVVIRTQAGLLAPDGQPLAPGSPWIIDEIPVGHLIDTYAEADTGEHWHAVVVESRYWQGHALDVGAGPIPGVRVQTPVVGED